MNTLVYTFGLRETLQRPPSGSASEAGGAGGVAEIRRRLNPFAFLRLLRSGRELRLPTQRAVESFRRHLVDFMRGSLHVIVSSTI